MRSLPTLGSVPALTINWIRGNRPSLVVVFTLMPHRKDGHGIARIDFEQCNVTARAKWNDQLPQERLLARSLATGERGKLKQIDRSSDRIESTFRSDDVTFELPIVESKQVLFGIRREADLIALH